MALFKKHPTSEDYYTTNAMMMIMTSKYNINFFIHLQYLSGFLFVIVVMFIFMSTNLIYISFDVCMLKVKDKWDGVIIIGRGGGGSGMVNI